MFKGRKHYRRLVRPIISIRTSILPMFTYIPSFAYEAPPFPEPYVVPTISATFEPKIARKRTFLQKVAISLAVVGLAFLAVSYGPSLYYTLRGSAAISNLLVSTAKGSELPADKKYSYQPAFNKNLPEINMVSIPSIGMRTNIEEANNENHEDALRKGVWRVNDFGAPYNRESPTILTAHRFGYLSWSLDFRLHNSFYNLPKVKIGDTVEVVWRQRKYVYSVYKEEEGDIISDYSADLILYTCKDLSSSVRVIKYAKLMQV